MNVLSKFFSFNLVNQPEIASETPNWICNWDLSQRIISKASLEPNRITAELYSRLQPSDVQGVIDRLSGEEAIIWERWAPARKALTLAFAL